MTCGKWYHATTTKAGATVAAGTPVVFRLVTSGHVHVLKCAPSGVMVESSAILTLDAARQYLRTDRGACGRPVEVSAQVAAEILWDRTRGGRRFTDGRVTKFDKAA